VLELIVEVVAPVLHANVFAPVPPEGVAVSVPETPPQTSVLFTETVGFGLIVKTTVSVAAPQFWLLVTVRRRTAVPVPVSVIVEVSEVGSVIATRPLRTDQSGVPFAALPARVKVDTSPCGQLA
jgi:hypothetical protein